ncbi:phosphatase PAP2 family protein (plasmid) [Rhizobium sp. CB3090]|uniref:phosphatase PAP2 family protein n=1 Tax=Rhizobium sp. CB3090 TaxID=3039156 RepID=UPI0024B27BA5|nr:phosphatase PAP2 family protein [Rhizobium sp. CB3090]WFU12366.1 phosphatase PAP2 family protein [Rhizobium sp. CB3090]
MSETSKARSFLIGLAVVCCASALILVRIVGVKVDPAGFMELGGFSVALLIFFSLLCHWREMPSLRSAAETTGFGLALTGPLVMLTYVAATASQPLQDRYLIRMDRSLGIDCHELITAIDAHAMLAQTLTFAYQTFGFQLLLVPTVLSMLGRDARAYQMIGAYGLICIFASIISIWYPALGTYRAFSVDIHQFKNINGSLGIEFAKQLVAVRDDPNFILRLESASGIISFPSVHAAVAVLCAWAAWEIKWVRWPFVLLNVLMICSAVTEGAHYIVDLISGIGVAGLTISLVLYITRSHSSGDLRVPASSGVLAE